MITCNPDEYTANLLEEIEQLKALLGRAASAIGEAGYEDFDTGLLDAIDKATEGGC